MEDATAAKIVAIVLKYRDALLIVKIASSCLAAGNNHITKYTSYTINTRHFMLSFVNYIERHSSKFKIKQFLSTVVIT